MNKSESKYFHTAECMDQAFLELLEEKDFEYITVKEICQRAGVNRSTFYLHYETIADLLEESVAYKNRQFASYFSQERRLDAAQIKAVPLEELYLITSRYLLPFLQYVKDQRRLFHTFLKKYDVLGSENHFWMLFHQVISPIMDRYSVPEAKKPFLISFSIEGIMGIIKVWLSSDCQEPIDFIAEIIADCIRRPGP